jgi:1,4-dihydroxy-2-naphthoate octaprenyltransferase
MSYILSPIFLWGFLVSSSEINKKFFIGFIAFHIFLYGGTNSFNSYYDKDEGPIGGLKNPPPVTKELLYFSLFMKILGIFLALFVNWLFVGIYLIAFLLSIAYSHPVIRWKSKPVMSAIVVALGQGGLGFLGGFVCGDLESETIFQVKTIIGAISASLITVGIYPLTQVYQMEEDSKRKDKTFAIALNVRGSFIFSLFSLGIAGIILISFVKIYFNTVEAFLLIFYFIFIMSLIYKWYSSFYNFKIMENYSRVMKINYINSTGFAIYIFLHIFKIL